MCYSNRYGICIHVSLLFHILCLQHFMLWCSESEFGFFLNVFSEINLSLSSKILMLFGSLYFNMEICFCCIYFNYYGITLKWHSNADLMNYPS